jgi:hypothetical protein
MVRAPHYLITVRKVGLLLAYYFAGPIGCFVLQLLAIWLAELTTVFVTGDLQGLATHDRHYIKLSRVNSANRFKRSCATCGNARRPVRTPLFTAVFGVIGGDFAGRFGNEYLKERIDM